jgi:hypothetical protein
MNYAAMLGEVAACAATDAANKMVMGEIPNFGAAQDYVASVMKGFFTQYGPEISQQLSALAEPAAKKAVETVKPAVMEALKEYTPIAASVFGGIVALSIILGVWIARKA